MNNKAAMLGLAVVAFLVAAVLVIMIFRMLFGGRLRMPGGRARQARLGIVDAFDLDRQRQLIIVRRDNVEHLIMIGGPNDVVIEAEIIRAEARDVRDTRREPGLAPGFGDAGRIPAPMPSAEGALPPDQPPSPRPSDEPMLPMPLPAAANAPAGNAAAGNAPAGSAPADLGAPPRSPTFPLPSRRPAPPQPERRPAPPPRLPDSVSRGDDVPAFSGQPASPAPAPPQPVPPPPMARPASPPQPSAPSAATPVAPAGPVAPPPAGPTDAPLQRPPFLKPAAPRPPIRPLQRTAPPTGAPRPPMPGAPTGPAPQPPTGARPPMTQRPGQPPAPPAAAPPKTAEPTEGLESLEEEMAKLLGRGS